MGRLSQVIRRVPSALQAVLGVLLGALWLWGSAYQPDMMYWLHGILGRGEPWGRSSMIEEGLWPFIDALQWMSPLVILGMIALPLGLLVRMVARARVRAGQSDPLEALRRSSLAHPAATRRLLAAPAVAFLSLSMFRMLEWGGLLSNISRIGHINGTFALTLALGAGLLGLLSRGVYVAARAGWGALVAPTLDADEVARTRSDERIGFDAVAITTETWAAVAAMAALPVVTFLAINAAHLGDTATQVALATYVGIALAGALAFRRASRIAVGVDGVFVSGTSRARFFPYKDLDAVRARGSDLQLTRGGRVVLRLQLHGEDAALKDEIALQIQDAIDTAKARETAAAGQIVASSSPAELERLAQGAADYRAPAVTREQLWSLVEGPEHGASTRTAAARALASGGDGEQRARLRVAADRCAEPEVRVALMELSSDADEEHDGAPVIAGRAARMVP
jgi:hypothetical protein